MTSPFISFDSLLALDISETNTRAILFDIVDGSYRFIAEGISPSTIGLPMQNVSEGARLAIDNLSEKTGRLFIGNDERLILPASGDGSGVDAMVIVLSGGPPLKVLITGLLEDVSVESARRLASTTYAQVVDTFSLNDRRNTEARLDAVLKLRPDLVLITGGTEGGAGSSITRMLEPVRLACSLLPADVRPQLLYAGNRELGEHITIAFSNFTQVDTAPNVRPTLEDEQIEPAHAYLARVYRNIAIRKLNGLQELDTWSGGGLMPRATAFGRIIRFLGLDDTSKGVFGIDVGVNSTTAAASIGEATHLGVYPEFGLGSFPHGLASKADLEQLMAWLPSTFAELDVQDYLANKSIYPATIPITSEELEIEHALARYVMRLSVQKIVKDLSNQNGYLTAHKLLPPIEPIVAAGRVLTNAPTMGQTVMMLLDAIQPVGITTIILDRNNLSAALGAAAGVNPTLAIQVLDSGTFSNLGTVVSPVSSVKPGTPILRVQMSIENDEKEVKLDIKQGSFEVLPLLPGQTANIYLKPYHRADIGMGPGKGGSLNRIVGGAMGVIIDARGRPIRLSHDPVRRQELLRKWLWSLGG